MWRRAYLVMVGVSWTACAAAISPEYPTSRIRSAGREVLTATEIVAARVTDVYQAVVELRPEFLRRRGGNLVQSIVAPNVAVYVDELPFGGIESLRSIPLDRVRLIRYMTPQEADLRWGGTHTAGAILVTTLK